MTSVLTVETTVTTSVNGTTTETLVQQAPSANDAVDTCMQHSNKWPHQGK